MARASKKEAEQHRKEIVAAASRLFRERGIGGVSVPELMAEAGLTHGGFYGHFASKEALAEEAYRDAFVGMATRIDELASEHPEGIQAARAAVFTDYLSTVHRDHPGAGCPTASLLDFARDTASGDVRRAYVGGIEQMIETIQQLEPPGDGARERALVTLSTLVGALLLARATKGQPLSSAFLDAAKAGLAVSKPD